MLAKHITVLVRRDMAEAITTSVFEHEVEILKDMHGEGNVELVADAPDFAPIEIDSAEEFDRLKGFYGNDDTGQLYAERVFGRSHKGLEAYAHKPAKRGKAAPAEAAE